MSLYSTKYDKFTNTVDNYIIIIYTNNMDKDLLYEKLNSILTELQYADTVDDRIELVRLGKKTLLDLETEYQLEVLKAQQ